MGNESLQLMPKELAISYLVHNPIVMPNTPLGGVGQDTLKKGFTELNGRSLKKAKKHEKEVKQTTCVGTRAPTGEPGQSGGRNAIACIH